MTRRRSATGALVAVAALGGFGVQVAHAAQNVCVAANDSLRHVSGTATCEAAGIGSVAVVVGDGSAASATGDHSRAQVIGDSSSAVAFLGDGNVATVHGDGSRSVASAFD